MCFFNYYTNMILLVEHFEKKKVLAFFIIIYAYSNLKAMIYNVYIIYNVYRGVCVCVFSRVRWFYMK